MAKPKAAAAAAQAHGHAQAADSAGTTMTVRSVESKIPSSIDMTVSD